MKSLVKPSILVVEDDASLAAVLVSTLQMHGFEITHAAKASNALALLEQCQLDLILLDLGLPDMNGIEVIPRIRAWSQMPIIVLSARGHENDKVTALNLGADDYLTKPFGTGELLARIRVALRHRDQRNESRPEQPVLRCGALEIHLARHEVHRDHHRIILTPTEYDLLVCLAHRQGQVVTHKQILKTVWGSTANTHQSDSLRVFIRTLRKKIEPDPARPTYLITEVGIGYRLTEPGMMPAGP
ncbi:response regulator transcription factor [Ectothiorhodospira lacustris]|uniref:response regulator transcription factor n=1 Tax=Ectothiorhodospira lacustris TaxID=2899127 RepID=UPI001EE863A2|nr:response regulator transcription factor [Ectothiorhodospira lacustris]MCG5501719.1 response regulator transcription factor [Ectothiorhodospira lacustris]